LQLPEGEIAVVAKQPPHFFRVVVVIYVQRLLFLANQALEVLLLAHLLVLIADQTVPEVPVHFGFESPAFLTLALILRVIVDADAAGLRVSTFRKGVAVFVYVQRSFADLSLWLAP